MANQGGGRGGFPGPDAVREVKVGLCWPLPRSQIPRLNRPVRPSESGVWVSSLGGWQWYEAQGVRTTPSCQQVGGLWDGELYSRPSPEGSSVPRARPTSAHHLVWRRLQAVLAAGGPSLPSLQGPCPGHPARGLLPAQDLNAEASALATVDEGQVRAPAGLRELLATLPRHLFQVRSLGAFRQRWAVFL